MEIRSVVIHNLTAEGLKGDRESLRHIKALPCLSIVQSVHGRYEIGLDDGAVQTTEEGGAFIAPAGVQQNILHRNGGGGYMEAQWVFMNVTVNDMFALEDVLELPLLIDASQREVLYETIQTVRFSADVCKRYAAAYQLLDLLMSRATPKTPTLDDTATRLKRYVEKHYSQTITKEDLANAAFCSVPHLYRVFQKHFHLSPSHYINKVRLQKASVFLECSDRAVSEIAQAVGFDDAGYFSRLFREQYCVSPKEYRRMVRLGDGE